MAHQKPNSQPPQIRFIYRQQLHSSLALAAVFASLLAGCDSSTTTTDQNADEALPAVFYETTEQCEADITKQQQEYQVLLEAHQQNQLAQPPTPPVMTVEDCAPQMQAALQEHDRTAPVYSSLADCQAEGVQCETTPANAETSGYRPTYGGTYLYPYSSPSFVYLNFGGSNRSVYQPHTVFRSSQPGQVVTPLGRTVPQTSPGPVSVPRHTSVVAPQRPTGTAARGTITGRSSQGFGSTFKSTGRGGK